MDPKPKKNSTLLLVFVVAQLVLAAAAVVYIVNKHDPKDGLSFFELRSERDDGISQELESLLVKDGETDVVGDEDGLGDKKVPEEEDLRLANQQEPNEDGGTTDQKKVTEPEALSLSYLAIGHRGGDKLSVFITGTWEEVPGVSPTVREPYGLEFSPSGRWLAASHSHGANLKVYETAGWHAISTPNLALNNVSFGWSVAFSPDEEFLAVGADTLFLIRTKDWSVVHDLPFMETGSSVYSVDFSVDGKYLAFTYKNEARILRISDLSLQTVFTWPGSTILGVNQVEFSPDGSVLAVGHYGESNRKDQYLTILSASDWSEIGSFYLDGSIGGLNFSPDSRFLAVGHQFGRGLTIFNVKDWTMLKGVPVPLSGGGDISTRDVAFSKDGKYLVATHAAVQLKGSPPNLVGKSVTVYDTINWSIDRTFPEIYGATSESATFSP
jgi:WD40 repeat protein